MISIFSSSSAVEAARCHGNSRPCNTKHSYCNPLIEYAQVNNKILFVCRLAWHHCCAGVNLFVSDTLSACLWHYSYTLHISQCIKLARHFQHYPMTVIDSPIDYSYKLFNGVWQLYDNLPIFWLIYFENYNDASSISHHLNISAQANGPWKSPTKDWYNLFLLLLYCLKRTSFYSVRAYRATLLLLSVAKSNG